MSGQLHIPERVRRVVIEERRQINPFNDRARYLTIFNAPTSNRNLRVMGRPLWLYQKDILSEILDKSLQESPPITAFRGAHINEVSYEQDIKAVQPGDDTPLLIHREDLFFDGPYFKYFWARAAAEQAPCQAAFYADDDAFRTYAVPLTNRSMTIVPDKDQDGKAIYRVPLWYFPNGVPEDFQTNPEVSNPNPIIVPSDAERVGYASIPSYMSQTFTDQATQGDLEHLLPMRSMLSIESWVHIYYANVIFGIFALGRRFEMQADASWVLRLRILLRAMLEQRQALSCSHVVHVGNNVDIDPSVVIQGPAWIGDNVVIEAGAVITNSIIGANTRIGNDCQLFLSTVGENCFLPFKASLFMTVLMEQAIVAQNTCLQMAVVGRNSFVGAGNTFTDFMMVPKFGGETLKADGPNGLEPTGQVVLGGCVGHNCRIGSGMVVHPARMIESDVILFSAPERRVLKRNISFAESDHHKLPPHRADMHPRMYPPMEAEEEEVLEEW